MVIRNSDGTPFQVTGSRSLFDPTNPDYELFNLWDQEAIEIGGSPIYYYEVFISQQAIDELYGESRSKVWSQYPVELIGMYEPIPSGNVLGGFGIDSPNDEIMIDFNYKYLLNKLGKLPKIGSRIFTPHLRENWQIIQFSTGEYRAWNILRLQMLCRKFQESLTTGEGKVTQGTVDGDIFPGKPPAYEVN
jgi:hypothetical protein